MQPRGCGSISERNVWFSIFHVICLTRGAGRYKNLISKLVACKNITLSSLDKEIGTTL